MKILGLEINKAVKQIQESKACQHDSCRAGDLDEGIYHCNDCGLACIYINQKLTPLTLENRHLNDKGTTINGIYQF